MMVGVVYVNITREAYDGRKECNKRFGDSRPVLQNVRVAALVILIQVRPVTVDSPPDSTSDAMLTAPPAVFYHSLSESFAINQHFCCSHRQTNLSLSLALCLSLSLCDNFCND